MADEDLRTMVREFRESMTSAMSDVMDRFEAVDRRFDDVDRRFDSMERRIDENSTRIEEQGNELRHRIATAETAILNTIRDQARLYDRRTSRLEARVDRIEERLDVPDDDSPGAA